MPLLVWMVTLEEPTAVTVPLSGSVMAGGDAFVPDVPDGAGVAFAPAVPDVPEFGLEPVDPFVVDVELGDVVVVVAALALMAVEATVPATAPNPRSPSPVATALGTRRLRTGLSPSGRSLSGLSLSRVSTVGSPFSFLRAGPSHLEVQDQRRALGRPQHNLRATSESRARSAWTSPPSGDIDSQVRHSGRTAAGHLESAR